jgi:hypothetical protein
MLSFHFLSFYKDFGNEIQNTEGGNVKGVGCVHGLNEQGIWIWTNHGTLLV